MGAGLLQYRLYDLLLFRQILWQSRFGQGKENKHGSVFLRCRNQSLEFLRLQGDGIDQGAARIDPQRLFHHIHITGIDAEWNIHRHSQFIYGTQHHFFFINAVHPHIDIKNLCSLSHLLLCHIQHHIQPALPEFGLKCLFACGIDPLTYDHKIPGKTDGCQIPLRRQRPDWLIPRQGKCPGRRLFFQQPDILWRRPAASPQHSGSGIHNVHHAFGKRAGVHIIYRPSILQLRQTGIGFRDNGNRGVFCHPFHCLHHLVRAGRAVDPHGVSTHCLQHYHGRLRVCTIQCPSVRLIGQRHHYRKIAGLLYRKKRGTAFLQAHHCLYGKTVHTCLRQKSRLFLIYLHQLLKGKAPHRLQLYTRHGDIPQQIDPAVRPALPHRLLRQTHKTADQFFLAVLQTVFRQLYAGTGKGGRIEHIRSRQYILFLKINKNIRMLRDPQLRAVTALHARPLKIGTGGTV